MDLAVRPKHRSFRHAGELPARYDRFDPRTPSYDVASVDIDLRECDFVRPSAAIWCVVYLSLALKRGCRARLLVPLNMGVCVYLKSLGLFEVLKQIGAEVDDRDISSRSDSKTILPLSSFRTTAEATAISNQAFDRLQSAEFGVVNLTQVVTELFSELTLNAAQHSESEVGAFACIQVVEYSQSPQITCTVADGGIGVLSSLRRNKALHARATYDWDALELAVRERVSGTGDPHRGIGLYGVSEDVRQPGRALLLHSGLGALEINENLESSARRTRLFPGTLAYLAIPTQG